MTINHKHTINVGVWHNLLGLGSPNNSFLNDSVTGVQDSRGSAGKSFVLWISNGELNTDGKAPFFSPIKFLLNCV